MNMSKFSIDFPQLIYSVRNNIYPAFPEFSSFLSRLKTFDSFICKGQSKYSMAESGFRYLGEKDYVQCFHCGLILKDWNILDKPHIEHAYWNPKCAFILLFKGYEFIEKAKLKNCAVCDCGVKHKVESFDVVG